MIANPDQGARGTGRSRHGHALAGTDPLADALSSSINDMLQGGAPGSKERTDRTEFFSDVVSLSGQKFVASPKGKAAIRDALFGFVVPAALVAFAAGYLVAKRRKG